MPVAVTAWSANTFPDAKSLNLALYTSDGTSDNPTGIAFCAYRPLLFEAYDKSTTFGTATGGGSQSTMTTAATVATAFMVYDTAGYFGQSSDLPGSGAYEFTSAIAGSAGDGVTAGGWMVLSHVAPITPVSTQTGISADIIHAGGVSISGSRQAPAGTVTASAPFFADLANVGAFAWQPAVTIADSAAASTTNVVNATDSSGQTPRFYAVWASVSATTSGEAQYTTNGSYEWTAPAGVTTVTVAGLGAGAGSGAGNVSGGGAEFGGGGGGGGEYASDSVAVTPTNNYPVTVGAGGTAGASPGGSGTAGGNSAFSGDVVTVTAHGGSLGAGATTGADGAGGAGGTGSAAATHHNGGAGVTGTSAYGGGGGSSAGPAVVGNAGSGFSGGAAPAGGGPGGTGGQASISIVQRASDTKANSTTLTVNFSSAVQAGNSVIASVVYQAGGSGSITTVALSDGTALNEDVTATYSGAGIPFPVSIYSVTNVTGGQTGVTVTASSGTQEVILLQIMEVAGLGSSPSTDTTGSATADSSSYSASASPTGSPDLWIGAAAAQNFDASLSINAPSGAWSSFSTVQDNSGTHHSGLRMGWQTAPAGGTETYSGTLDDTHFNETVVAAYTSSSGNSPGSSPLIKPGGGAGAGLGSSASGAAGLDGYVTLTWTGVSGGGYGTPALPAPYTAWSPATRIGTSGDADVDVDLNSVNGITDVINFLANPPIVRVQTTTAQSIANASVVSVTLASGTTSVDSYAGYASGTYTVQRDGLYLCHGQVCFAANTTGTRQAAFTINNQSTTTTYWGPGYRAASTGTTNATKTAIFSLRAGDTVKLAAYQTSGGSLNTDTTAATRFFMAWICAPGAPVQSWTPPDTTFRWASGTPGSELGALFQTHLGNDLGFLVNRPLLMAYQTSAQSSLTVGSYSTLVLDTVAGIVHADSGDTYSGWTSGASNKYTAPVNGWYLVCGEYFAASSAASGASVAAGIKPSTSGGATPSVSVDTYQVATATSTASVGGGATVLGLSYMLAGESLQPQIKAIGYAAAYGTLTGTQNSGLFRPHLEIVWLSE